VSNSTEEFWSITGTDGVEVSLHQYGWAVTTVGGSRYDLPPRRGSDMTMAYRPGQVHRRKLPDARPITLLMFMVGWDAATGNIVNPDQRLQWNDNWDTLRRLVFRHSLLKDQRVRLTRRWFLTAPTFPTVRSGDNVIQGDPGVPAPGSRLLTAFTFAEMTGTMAPAMTGRFRSEFQLDFTVADPYFYGSTVSVDLDDSDPVYVWNDGHDVAAPGFMQVDLYGPLTNPRITNLSTEPDSWVQYNGVIAAGEHIRYVVNRFTCEQVVSSGTNVNKVNNISYYGARWWVNMLPGANKIQMTYANSGVGTIHGTATIAFRPPYV
jgi:hypothetical protein